MRETRRGIRLGLMLAALLAGGAAACRGDGELPPEDYARVVGAFYTGLAALEAGDNDRALIELERVTELAPGEAAGWANLALARLRAGDAAGADAALAKAREAGPDDADVDWLAGVFASRAGASDEAIAAWERAVAREPGHLRARFALVEELGRQAAPDGDARIAAHLDAVLEARPGNLLALLERARLGARAGDTAAVEAAANAIDERRAELPEDARAQLDALRAALEGGASGEVALALATLGNVLLPTAAYQADFAALKSEYGAVGEPLYRFASLPAPSPRPAPADRTLAFAIDALDVDGAAGAVHALLVDPDAEPMPAVEIADEGSNALVLVDGAGIRLSTPGGAPLARHGVLAVDLDGDGTPEIAMAGDGGLSIHRRGAGGAWSDVTGDVIDDDLTAPAYSGVWAVDIELDGDIDLVVAGAEGARGPGYGAPPGPLVLVNGGDGSWTSTSPFAGATAVEDVAWADLDGDGDPDVALLAEGEVAVFDNARGGTYTAIAGPDLYGASALTVADPDRDGRLELVAAVAGPEGQTVRSAARSDGGWETATLVATDALAVEGPDAFAPAPAVVLVGDLDNNGASDLIAAFHGSSAAFLADADGSLVELGELGFRAAALADLDGDGRLEVLGMRPGERAALRASSTGEAEYGWQLVRPRAIAAGDQRNNAFGLGGQAEVRAGLLVQKQPIASGVLHFGLGDQPSAQALRIRWPNGTFQAEFDVAPSTDFVANQRLKGSCPWLFAWDGSEMAFVTDVLWRSPLGLRINAQATAGVVQTFDRVRIPGAGLALRDGAYDLRITAELWETHFFDLVGLQAVDHPAGTEVHVDERFSIPPPPLEPVVTGPVRPVDRAVDDRGGDHTAAVAERDGAYAQSVPIGRYQGVTVDHALEVTVLDPPPSVPAGVADAGAGDVAAGAEAESDAEVQGGTGAAPARGPWLVAHGWVYPTDSSLNVALSQGSHPPPAGLRLEVPDEAAPSGWRTHRDGLGFPAGKRKTLLIDLADVPRAAEGALRVRLATNLEVYWDALGVAEVRPETPRLTPAVLASAELAYRGFSYTNRTAPDVAAPVRSVPEIPYYDRIASTTPLWLDLRGFHTRFGDVAPLLAAVDDRYAILNAGDELRLRFEPLPPPPAGWVRDYVFESDGWEKDGDLNTAYGATVQPLPSHDRPEYADPTVFGPVGPLAEEAAYRKHPDDWRDYHTRYVSPWPAENAMRRVDDGGAADLGGER